MSNIAEFYVTKLLENCERYFNDAQDFDTFSQRQRYLWGLIGTGPMSRLVQEKIR